VTFNPFEVVVVPFPFTDRESSKRRPALVLSNLHFNSEAEHCVLAMITSFENSPWPLDSQIKDLQTAGLPSPSKVRMKLFTLDQSLILKKLGVLSKTDKKSVQSSLNKLFD
jgi:mRNA interferase MazF